MKMSTGEILARETKALQKSIASDLKKKDKNLEAVLAKLEAQKKKEENNESN